MPDPSWVWNLYFTSWQRRILNPLREAGNWTLILMGTSWVCYHWATTGTLHFFLFKWLCRLFPHCHEGTLKNSCTLILLGHTIRNIGKVLWAESGLRHQKTLGPSQTYSIWRHFYVTKDSAEMHFFPQFICFFCRNCGMLAGELTSAKT